MAMTDEELLLQMNILATKTDSTTNPNMLFKTNATLNKGLNPDYFSGNYTKIVNALNQLAVSSNRSESLVSDISNKMNEILLDISSTEGSATWENVKTLMGKSTIIEGIEQILSGKLQDKILNISVDDVGKVLIVDKDSQGKIITSTIEVAGLGEAVKAEDVVYSNPDRPEFANVQSVLDYILNNEGNFGGGSGSSGPVEINWDDILGKPAIPTGLSLTETQLCLNSEEENMSAVDLATDQDIDSIIQTL
jgi:hypothetical protein